MTRKPREDKAVFDGRGRNDYATHRPRVRKALEAQRAAQAQLPPRVVEKLSRLKPGETIFIGPEGELPPEVP